MSYILFCVNATHNNNSLRIESIIKDLVELSLIKCDPDNDNLNIHRLVQDEFNFQLSDSDRESVFNSAALLLYEAFPKQINGERFEDRLLICGKYIQHVYCLIGNLNVALNADKQLKRPPSITPCAEYVRLMTNAAWYCVERQDHFKLESVLENAFQAININGMKDIDPLPWAHLCNSAGRLWGQRGYFERGERNFLACLEIRKEIFGRGDENIAGLLSNLGNINLSMARYDTALDYQRQALDWGVVDGRNELSPRAQAIIMINTARVLTDLGHTEEARNMFRMSDKITSNKQSSL